MADFVKGKIIVEIFSSDGKSREGHSVGVYKLSRLICGKWLQLRKKCMGCTHRSQLCFKWLTS